MNIVDVVVQYWGIGAVVVGGIGYFFTHKQTSIAYAKGTISKAMLAAEKSAEEFALENGQAKFDWVVEKGYGLLPPAVKAFVSKQLFAILVQKLFDEAKQFVEAHKKA